VTRSQPRPIEIELNPPERRLYDRVRRRLVPSRPAREPSGLRDVALLLPDMTVLLTRLLRDDRVAVGDKAIALLGVGYVLSPVDVLPEFLLGPLGLLDDVLVVTATLSRVVNHVHPDVVRSHWPGQGDALQAIQRLSDWSERQVSSRLPGLLRRLLSRS
jgi:uncharacterized membrane protein YkvA (DUF1232 family)